MQQDSIIYIQDNKSVVTKANQNTLVLLNVFYFIVLVGYFVASLNVFSEWHVARFYAAALILHIFMLVFVLLRYGKTVRSYREVCSMCTVFQLYAMTFTGIMSIVPIEMNQPAVYFMPLTMAFVAAFVFSFYHSITLVFVELGAYTIASYLTKSSEIFVIDLFSCILGVFLSVLVAKILFSHRARENESRQQLRRTGMIDQLTSTYNKATTEFLCREYMREHPLLPCVMMILDFDNFKTVNDTYGHQAGDVVLRSFGRILKQAAGQDHIAGRIGGDEFFLLFKNCRIADVERKARDIQEETRRLRAPDGSQPFSCSIGIAVGPPQDSGEEYGTSAYDKMFARADRALYEVKKNGKNNYRIDS